MSTSADFRATACPHDCPSTCALEVERIDAQRIGKVRGAADNSYTAGVICSKVSRYTERIHHPDRVLHPQRRIGSKGSQQFERITWEQALDEVAEALLKAEQQHGSESVWPYYYAGTMGLVMRDGINCLRHVKRYSGQHSTICSTASYSGFIAGTGRLAGVDPREMALADLVIIWGTNAASTQVNVMTHALRAQRNRAARLVVIDTYRNATAKQADDFFCIRPGSDGALACALMHVLFRDQLADRAYLSRYSDCPKRLEEHLRDKTPAWAAAITGLEAAAIEKLAREIGHTQRTFFRLGFGFTRQRNGAVNMHAALSVSVVAGCWQYRGGGAFHSNGAIFHWDKTLIEGLDRIDPGIRLLDQSRIGPILCGDRSDLLPHRPPVTALLIQSTNPLAVAPEQSLVRRGFMRDDLFVCVHEQFMTDTAKVADIVLPATMFLEHDDVYQAGGQQHILLGPQIIEPPGECRSNHQLISDLAQRLGAEHAGLKMSSREIIDHTLKASGWGALAQLEAERWFDCQPDFATAHYLNGFATGDGRFHFAADWKPQQPPWMGPQYAAAKMPQLPDHWPVIEQADSVHPFRLVTAPARNYLNSSFNEAATSQRRESRPTLMVHPTDAAAIGLGDNALARVGNQRGAITLHAQHFNGVQSGVVIIESIWPNHNFALRQGINTLTSADRIAPIGGAAFHDTAVWVRCAAADE